MKSLSLSRKAGLSGIAAGVSWTILGIASLLADNPERYLDALMFVPLLLTSIAFFSLHRLQQSAFDRFGVASYWLSAVSLVLLLICQPLLALGIDRFNWLAFPVAALAWFLGFLMYGIATIKAKALPTWIGAAIGLSELLAMALGIAFSPISPLADHGDYSGGIGHGLVWLSIGYFFMQRARASSLSISTQPLSQNP
jgi:hypothetical protein